MAGQGKVNCSGVPVSWEGFDLELDLPAMVVLVWEVQLQLFLMGGYPGGQVEHGFQQVECDQETGGRLGEQLASEKSKQAERWNTARTRDRDPGRKAMLVASVSGQQCPAQVQGLCQD